MRFVLEVILIVSVLVTTITAECGYSVCHKTDPKKLNIHLIPHSHDDVGWLRTVDAYYIFEVRNIITNYVKSLQMDPNRRFTQVETYFFHRWWSEQNDETRNVYRKLVANGQIVFSNGGWTVNDEGAAHYNNIIDQMTLGLRFLDKEFGKCGHPKVSWQIDPFGASKEMASLYSQMGFDGHIVNRGVPHGEFIWKGSKDLGTKSEIFTSVLHNHYSAPNGFNFDNGNDLTDANKAQKSAEFVRIAQNWNRDYGNTNQVLMTMGDDFQYQHSERWFSNMDKLIKEITATHKDINIFYSTPNCYIYEVNKLNKTYGERDVDYLNYWVGYYSNHPSLKREDRIGNAYLQASKQLDVLARLNPDSTRAYLDEARNEQAIMTHHDAITGTSPQDTVDDYSRRLYSEYTANRVVIEKAYKHLSAKTEAIHQTFCDTLNMTECTITETSDRIAVTIYNPIARPLSQYIRVPIGSGNYDVYDPNGAKVAHKEVVPVSKAVGTIPERKSKATHELVFRANLLPLGFVTYLLKKTNTLKKRSIAENLRKKRAPFEMKGKSFTLQIDEQSGALKSITTNGKTHALRQSFKYYRSGGGVRNMEDSGSYHFCPNGSAHDYGTQKLISKFSSGSVHEIHQQFSDYVSQTVRTYDDEDYIEFDWIVGPLPIEDKVGKEVVTRFETDLKNNKEVFYTDANGRQMVKRMFNPKARSCTNNVIAANWYPIYSRISLIDDKEGLEMTVLNDRTQGGGSLADGSVELMVHRRLTHEGAGGPFKIDEHGSNGRGLIVRGKHYLFLKPVSESVKYVREMSERLFMEPIVSFAKYNSTEADFKAKHVTTFSGLNMNLPENVHLLTLENWKKNQILLRLEHFYESSDKSELSKPVEVNLENLFKGFKIMNVVETTLAANEILSESKRLKWNSHQWFSEESQRNRRAIDFKVHLTPQQIRTFILTIDNSNVEPLEKCVLSWSNVKANKIPSDAIVGGFDINKSPLYICRHELGQDLIPGKANAQIGCHLSNAGKEVEIKTEDYEVLIGKNVEWVPRHGTDPLPHNAYVSGKKSNGQPVYIGRCDYHDSKGDSETVGKVDYRFYFPFGSTEHSDCGNHQILVCN